MFKFQPNSIQNTWSIGRVEDNDICLAGDDEVSSKHAQISFVRKQFKVCSARARACRGLRARAAAMASSTDSS